MERGLCLDNQKVSEQAQGTMRHLYRLGSVVSLRNLPNVGPRRMCSFDYITPLWCEVPTILLHAGLVLSAVIVDWKLLHRKDHGEHDMATASYDVCACAMSWRSNVVFRLVSCNTSVVIGSFTLQQSSCAQLAILH